MKALVTSSRLSRGVDPVWKIVSSLARRPTPVAIITQSLHSKTYENGIQFSGIATQGKERSKVKGQILHKNRQRRCSGYGQTGAGPPASRWH